MAPIYSQHTNGALLVFDLTRQETLDHLPQWRSCLTDCDEGIPIIVVGNKSDLEDSRNIPFDEGMEKCQQMNANYFETSAESGAGVVDVFTALAEGAIRRQIHGKEEQSSVVIEASVQKSTASRKSRC
jgi:GTPase SAR1 family protein